MQAQLNYYRFSELPKVDNHDERIKSPVINKSGSKTLKWLVTQVKPAFQKLVLEGVISDPYKWLEENFIEDIKGEPKTTRKGMVESD
jgi:hypothetical protein